MSEKYVIVDLRKVSEATEDEVTVQIVSDRFDDPHEASGELKRRENNRFSSSGKFEVVAIPDDNDNQESGDE